MSVSTGTAERIVEKAEFIETCLEMLVEKQSVGPEEYERDVETRDVVERRFEKMTQACIDVAQMLLVEMDVEVPEAYSSTMQKLDDTGVLSPSTAEAMAEACAFRNVLAHQYGNVVDDGIVYDALHDLARYREFLVEIRTFLAEDGAI